MRASTQADAKAAVAAAADAVRDWRRMDFDDRAAVLLKAQFISESDYKSATENRKRNARPWDEVLITQGRLKPNLVSKATNTVIKEIMLDIFQWREGSYRFEDWDLNTEGMLQCSIPTEGLILNTLRIIDEWPIIKAKIPPGDYCPVTIMPITQELVRAHDLSDIEMRIFDLIDGTSTIEAIVRRSLEAPIDALGAFVRLIEANLVEVFPQGTRENRDLINARQILWERFKHAAVFLLLGASVLALSLWGRPALPLRDLASPAIRTHLKSQQDLAQEYARRGIQLSDLGRDSSDR